MAEAAPIPLAMVLLALLTTLHLHAQGDAVNATNLVCGSCKCCLNPEVCLTTCCFEKTCAGSVCSLRSVSCGCNACDYPHHAGATK